MSKATPPVCLQANADKTDAFVVSGAVSECMAVRMALATAAHHSSQRVSRVTEYVAPAPSSSYAAPAPVIEYVTPTPTVCDASPAPVTYHVTPAPSDSYATPATVNAYVVHL